MKRTKVAAILLLITSSIMFCLVIAATLPHRIDRLLLLNNDLCSLSDSDTTNLRFNKLATFFDVDVMLWKAAIHMWQHHHETKHGVCVQSKSNHKFAIEGGTCGRSEETSESSLHPMCRRYRLFRSTIQIQRICIPWNWYYSCRLWLRGVSIRSSTAHLLLNGMHEPNNVWGESWGTSCIHLHLQDAVESGMQLPSALDIDSINIKFESWTKPVISIDVHGSTLKFVLQKGRLVNSITNHQLADNTGLSIQIGDMTIPEAISMIPKSPEKEGLYPMVGTVSITNMSLDVVERSNRKSDEPFHNLTSIKVPDELFIPLVNLTSAHQPQGIDRFHFQSLLESEFSNAFRRYLFNEAEKALQSSLTAAMELKDQLLLQNNKLQDQFQNFVHKTQQLYENRLLELTSQTKQIWMNNNISISSVLKSWSHDAKKLLYEPTMDPSIKIVMVHHWERISKWMNRQDIIVDKIHWDFNDLKRTFGEVLSSCEDEIKDMWLSWHKQFMPILE